MNSRKKRALTGFTLILMYIFGFLVFWFFNFQRVVVRGNSMLPTFTNGQVVWASKTYWLVGPISRDDVVVIHNEDQGGYLIKRVKYLPGEVVPALLQPTSFSFRSGEDSYVVPQNSYYVLGDNRKVSEDSRDIGAVPATDVLGKYVPFTWAGYCLAMGPVLLLLLFAFSRPSREENVVAGKLAT